MSKIELQLEAIQEHLKEHDQRFERLEGRFDKLEGRFDKLEERFGYVEIRFERTNTLLELLAQQMSGFFRENRDVRQRVEVLEEKDKLTDLRLRSLEKRK